MRRTRFQQGSLQIVKRAGGRKAWEYRWYELQANGSRTRRNLTVGSLEQYPNETAAQKAVAALRADINAENPRTSPVAKEIGIVGHFGWHTFRHTYATLLKGNGEDVKVVQELMRHANISVTLNVYAQAITQTKRDAQSRVVSLLLDKNDEKPSTAAYRTVTDLQNSGGDLQVVDKVGVPDGI
jgi:hypothetical protein